MFTAMVLVVETDESHQVPGKFPSRPEAIDAAKNVVKTLMETHGEGFTYDFIITPLE